MFLSHSLSLNSNTFHTPTVLLPFHKHWRLNWSNRNDIRRKGSSPINRLNCHSFIMLHVKTVRWLLACLYPPHDCLPPLPTHPLCWAQSLFPFSAHWFRSRLCPPSPSLRLPRPLELEPRAHVETDERCRFLGPCQAE